VNARSHTLHPADSRLFQPSKAGSGLIARKPLWLRASWASPLHTGITHPMAQPDSWNQNRHGITSSMPWDKTSSCRQPTCCLIFSRSHATLSSGRGKWFFAQWSWNAWHWAKAKGQALLNSEPWSPFSSKQESLLYRKLLTCLKCVFQWTVRVDMLNHVESCWIMLIHVESYSLPVKRSDAVPSNEPNVSGLAPCSATLLQRPEPPGASFQLPLGLPTPIERWKKTKGPRGQSKRSKCLKISQRMSKMALPLGHKQDRLLDSGIFRVYTCISISKFLNSKRAYLMIASKQNSDLWTNVSIGFLWQSTRGFPDCVQPAVRIRMANKNGAQEASRCRWKLGCSSGSCKLFTVSCWQELQRTAACLVDSTGAFCDHEVCWQSWRFREASRLSTKLLCKWQECN